ncbi:MAG: outer membrane beta-barrel protein [Acidiferrobacteraceae bacterium]
MRDHPTKTILAAALAGTLLMTVTGAAEASSYSWPSGLYLGAGGGVARERNIQNNLTLPGTVTATSKRHTAWKAFAGFDAYQYFAVEAGYVHFGTGYASSATTGESVSVAQSGPYLDAVLKFPFTRHFGVFAKGGADYIRSNVTDSITGERSTRAARGTYGAGLKYSFTRNVAVRGEWERFRIPHNNTDLLSASAVFTFR